MDSDKITEMKSQQGGQSAESLLDATKTSADLSHLGAVGGVPDDRAVDSDFVTKRTAMPSKVVWSDELEPDTNGQDSTLFSGHDPTESILLAHQRNLEKANLKEYDLLYSKKPTAQKTEGMESDKRMAMDDSEDDHDSDDGTSHKSWLHKDDIKGKNGKKPTPHQAHPNVEKQNAAKLAAFVQEREELKNRVTHLTSELQKSRQSLDNFMLPQGKPNHVLSNSSSNNYKTRGPVEPNPSQPKSNGQDAGRHFQPNMKAS